MVDTKNLGSAREIGWRLWSFAPGLFVPPVTDTALGQAGNGCLVEMPCGA
jgi:hypothetical protein